jgi:hypothetical protein
MPRACIIQNPKFKIQNSSSHPMSDMHRLPTLWVIPDPGVKLVRRGNVYYAQPIAEKPAKQPKSRAKSPKSTTKKPT